MSKLAVVKTGGKQYLVKTGDKITVEKLEGAKEAKIDLETLAIIDSEKGTVELGAPTLSKKVSAQVVEQGKGEKVRISRFKSKVRFRKARGFRASLTTLKIGTV